MKHRWLWAWLLQIVELLAAGLLAALAQGAGALAGGLALWGLMPLAALFCAYRAVCRGLNNYAALIAPAPCLYLSNLLVWGYAPPAGPALVTALAGLVGAAAGQVALERGKQHRRGPHGRN